MLQFSNRYNDLCIFTENLRLTEKQTSKNKNQEKIPSNLVKNNKKKAEEESKKDTAEDRAKKELDKIAAYQARLAKKSNKQRKIRTVIDESNYNTVQQGIISYYLIMF